MGEIIRPSKWSSYILSSPLYTILKLIEAWEGSHLVTAIQSMFPSCDVWQSKPMVETLGKEFTSKSLPHILWPYFYAIWYQEFFFFQFVELEASWQSREVHLCPGSVYTNVPFVVFKICIILYFFLNLRYVNERAYICEF